MRYVAFFRGINVGGKNLVKMNDLEQFLLDLGLCKVKTYIQSGNAVFETQNRVGSRFREAYVINPVPADIPLTYVPADIRSAPKGAYYSPPRDL